MLLICLMGRKSQVRVSQVVIPNTSSESSFVEVWKQKMDLLKACETGPGGKKSRAGHRFGFQITCCGRGSSYHADRENYESSLFFKSFPDVSLTGFFANGEIGCDYLPPSSAANKSTEKSPSRKQLIHNELEFLTFSSVFTLVSIY